MNLEEDGFSIAIGDSGMDKIYNLQTKLMVNVKEIDNIEHMISTKEIQTPDDMDGLELLYKNAFMLYMNNIGCYEDLMLLIDREPKTQWNEFELKKIQRQAEDLCLVEVIQ